MANCVLTQHSCSFSIRVMSLYSILFSANLSDILHLYTWNHRNYCKKLHFSKTQHVHRVHCVSCVYHAYMFVHSLAIKSKMFQQNNISNEGKIMCKYNVTNSTTNSYYLWMATLKWQKIFFFYEELTFLHF